MIFWTLSAYKLFKLNKIMVLPQTFFALLLAIGFSFAETLPSLVARLFLCGVCWTMNVSDSVCFSIPFSRQAEVFFSLSEWKLWFAYGGKTSDSRFCAHHSCRGLLWVMPSSPCPAAPLPSPCSPPSMHVPLRASAELGGTLLPKGRAMNSP